MLKVSNLSVSGQNQQILRDINFNVDSGKAYALIGEDSAKRLLLRLALKQNEDSCVYVGVDTVNNAPKRLKVRPFSFFTVMEYFFYNAGALRCGKNQIRQRALELLARVGIERLHNTKIGRLSLLEYKLMQIALAMWGEPNSVVIYADELKPNKKNRLMLNRALARLKSLNVAVLVSLKPKMVASAVDVVGILREGRLVAEGSPQMICMKNTVSVYDLRSDVPIARLKSRLKEITAQKIKTKNKKMRVYTKEHDQTALDIIKLCRSERVNIKSLNLHTPSLERSIKDLMG